MKSRLLLFGLAFMTLLALVPSLSLRDVGKTATRAEAAPAGGLAVVWQACISHDRVRVQFFWFPSGSGPQWLDLSLQNNGFAPNTFIGAGPMGSLENTLVWDGLIEGSVHYARVNTLSGSVWQPSGTIAFKTITCLNPIFQGASGVHIVSQACLPNGTVRIVVGWQASGHQPQWVDLSLHNNGFAPGTFVGAGPLAAHQESLVWDGLLDGLVHYLRVNTLTPGGWVPSFTIAFKTVFCVALPAGFSTDDKFVAATGVQQTVLDDVRVGAHPGDGFDRIVFEFDGPIPATTIGYQPSAVACGSGFTVPVLGSGTLIVRFDNAVAHNDMGMTTSPLQVGGTGVAILEARSICDFEGIVSWAVGTDGVRPFRVFTLTGPNRVVIDILR
jgi:hypothetical protein